MDEFFKFTCGEHGELEGFEVTCKRCSNRYMDKQKADLASLTARLAASEAALATERERGKRELDEMAAIAGRAREDAIRNGDERDAALVRAEKVAKHLAEADDALDNANKERDATLSKLREVEGERDKLRARVANHALAMECTPSAALSKIADALKEPMHCGHGLDCLNDSVKGEEYCVWCALIDETGEVERLKRTLRATHEMLNELKAQPYDARVFNAEILCLRINSALAAARESAVRGFAEWLRNEGATVYKRTYAPLTGEKAPDCGYYEEGSNDLAARYLASLEKEQK